jgi:hypothetical protein
MSIEKEELVQIIGSDILKLLETVMQSKNRNTVGSVGSVGKQCKDKSSKSIFKVLFNIPSNSNLGDQGVHYDYVINNSKRLSYMPYSALFAVMPYSCLDLDSDDGETKRLNLDVGDVLILSGCVAHRGLAYNHLNLRIFAYYPTFHYTAQDQINWVIQQKGSSSSSSSSHS